MVDEAEARNKRKWTFLFFARLRRCNFLRIFEFPVLLVLNHSLKILLVRLLELIKDMSLLRINHLQHVESIFFLITFWVNILLYFILLAKIVFL